jgi:uncharacterized protein
MKTQRSFKFQVKELGESGTFTGLAAVYGNVDQGGDVIDPGAFTRTLAAKGGEVPILYQHRTGEPIGIGRLTDSKDGLVIEGELVLDVPQAQSAYALMKKGVLKGLSIGFETLQEKVVNGTRYLKEIKLWEVSLVTFPMNELALVSNVKSAEEWDVLLAEISAGAKGNPELQQKLWALVGEFAPPLATQETIAPEVLHAKANSILEILRNGN